MFPLSLGGMSPVLFARGLPIRMGSGTTAGLYDCAASYTSDQSTTFKSKVSARANDYNENCLKL